MDALTSYFDGINKVAKLLSIKSGIILVTGATGLIGSCIIDVLLAANSMYNADYKIYALGRDRNKIVSRFGNKVVPIVQNIVDKLPMNVEYDYIIHAASNADPRTYAIQPVETVLTNVIGNNNIFEYCRYHKKTRVILTSSFEVYGKIENHDIYKEEDCGILDFQILRNGYPESKRCAEILLHSYVEEYNIDAVIARLSSIYGPTMQVNDSKAHAQFIRNALHGDNIVLKSKGLPRRTYCYVTDAASAILYVLFNGKTGEVYNIANEKSIASIAEVAQTIAGIVGTSVVFDFPDEIESKGFSKPQNCILDNSKLRKLGWHAEYILENGMRETIQTLKFFENI